MMGKSKDSVKRDMAPRPVRGRSLTLRERKELKALEKMPDHAIDTSDIPEITDWSEVKTGQFFRGTKERH